MNYKVLSLHCPLHADTIARALGGEVVSEVTPCDWMVFPFVHPNMIPLVEKCREQGIKTCGYWLGSDSFMAACKAWERIPKFDLHISVHERLQKELADVGINSEVVYFLARNLPTGVYEECEPTAAIYMPTPKGKYKFSFVCEIASDPKMHDIKFRFYGREDLGILPDNCRNYGKLSPAEASDLVWNKCTVVLRPTVHDGLPQNVIEAKMARKHCIVDYPYQGCLYAKTTDQFVDLLLDPNTHKPDISDWPQWYFNNCSPQAFFQTMERLCASPT